MKTLKFTLVELLVVIAVIGILVSLLMPAISGAIEEAKYTKAFSEINSLAHAVEQYIETYGVPPLLENTTENIVVYGGTDGETENLRSKNYDKLIVYLTMMPIRNKKRDIIKPEGMEMNRKAYNFLSMTARDAKNGFTDPWEMRYCVIFNAQLTRKTILVNEVAQELNGNVFVYSYGPNRRNDHGLRQEQGKLHGISDADDIASWSVEPLEE